MIRRLYCLFDRVAQESNDPFCAKNDGVAVRGAEFALGQRGVRPDEHRLFFIGTFDSETSEIVPEVPRVEVPLPERKADGQLRLAGVGE